MKTVIISRHPGLVAWLATKGITGEVVSHLEGIPSGEPTNFVGILPVQVISDLLNHGHEFVSVILPSIRAEDRGKELSPAEMDSAGARLLRVREIQVEDF
jgi:putative CRISPR-associated protein (TIGR02620 family)